MGRRGEDGLFIALWDSAWGVMGVGGGALRGGRVAGERESGSGRKGRRPPAGVALGFDEEEASAGLALEGAAHRQTSSLEIDVVPGQRQRLADSESRGGQQDPQRVV